MANDPGWYPDPWRPGQRRWWDGDGWTDHTWDPSAPHAAPHVIYPDPHRDLDDERRAAMWAKRGFVAWFVGRLAGGLLTLFVINDIVDDVQAVDSGKVGSSSSGLRVLQTPLSIVSLLALVAIIIWTYKAAGVARNLRYPARRTGGWVVAGWLVPVINLWFPYQTVRDCLPPGHPARRAVKQWWALFLLGVFVWILAAFVAAVASVGVAFAVALPAVIAGVIEVSLALRIVEAIEDDHRAAINRVLSSGS